MTMHTDPTRPVREPAPKVCPGCGHPFHRGDQCPQPESAVAGAWRCPCQRNMAFEFTPQPETRNAHDFAASHEDLLIQILAELKRLNSRDGSVSSVEVKFLANGTPQPTVKVYAGSEAPVDEAIEAYGRTVLMATQGALEGWEQTVDVLQRERTAAS